MCATKIDRKSGSEAGKINSRYKRDILSHYCPISYNRNCKKRTINHAKYPQKKCYMPVLFTFKNFGTIYEIANTITI